jgi:hypothetical protein
MPSHTHRTSRTRLRPVLAFLIVSAAVLLVAPSTVMAADPSDPGEFQRMLQEQLAVGAPEAIPLSTRIDPFTEIDNGTVALGVNPAGQLIIPPNPALTGTTGDKFLPTGNDGLRQVFQGEGWGAGNAGTPTFSGIAHNVFGVNVVVEKFRTTDKNAESVTVVDDQLKVTHEFKPAPRTPFLYYIEVTLRNIGDSDLTDVRYTRVMDWDVEPTPFLDVITLESNTPAGSARPQPLRYSDDNGFQSPDPFLPRVSFLPTTANQDFMDVGPFDHGALLDFQFMGQSLGPDGALRPGQSKKFAIYYGAAPSEAAALQAINDEGVEVYSLGQTATGGPTGTPNTFIFGFEDDSGREIDEGPPDSPQASG